MLAVPTGGLAYSSVASLAYAMQFPLRMGLRGKGILLFAIVAHVSVAVAPPPTLLPPPNVEPAEPSAAPAANNPGQTSNNTNNNEVLTLTLPQQAAPPPGGGPIFSAREAPFLDGPTTADQPVIPGGDPGAPVPAPGGLPGGLPGGVPPGGDTSIFGYPLVGAPTPPGGPAAPLSDPFAPPAPIPGSGTFLGASAGPGQGPQNENLVGVNVSDEAVVRSLAGLPPKQVSEAEMATPKEHNDEKPKPPGAGPSETSLTSNGSSPSSSTTQTTSILKTATQQIETAQLGSSIPTPAAVSGPSADTAIAAEAPAVGGSIELPGAREVRAPSQAVADEGPAGETSAERSARQERTGKALQRISESSTNEESRLESYLPRFVVQGVRKAMIADKSNQLGNLLIPEKPILGRTESEGRGFLASDFKSNSSSSSSSSAPSTGKVTFASGGPSGPKLEMLSTWVGRKAKKLARGVEILTGVKLVEPTPKAGMKRALASTRFRFPSTQAGMIVPELFSSQDSLDEKESSEEGDAEALVLVFGAGAFLGIGMMIPFILWRRKRPISS